MDHDRTWLECLDTTLETVRESVVITDAQLDPPGPRIVYTNAAFTGLTGYTPDEVLGKTPRLLQGADTDPAVTTRLRRRLEAGRQFYGQIVNYRKDDTPFLMEWSVVPVRGEDGAVHHYVCVQREVTAGSTAGKTSPDETLHRQMFEQHSAVMLLIDPVTGAIVDGNPAAEAYYGWSRATLREMAITQINTLAPIEVEREMARAEQEERNYFRFRHRLASGDERDVEVHSTPVVVDGRQYLHSIVHDVTERRRINEALAAAEARYRSVLGNLREVVFETDTQGLWTFLSPAWASLTGHSVDASLGRPFSAFVDSDDGQRAWTLFAQLLAGDRATIRGEVRFVTTDGASRWLEVLARPRNAEDGTTAGATGTLIDITERKQAEAELHARSYYDSLTRLPNRSLFQDRLDHAIRRAERDGNGFSVLSLNLDGFKDINNARGHKAGDHLLQEVAERLGERVRSSDTLARIGGDEFALIVEPAPNDAAVETVAEKVLAVFAAPFEIEQRPITIQASIGLSVYPKDGSTAALLLQHADAALHHAKQRGGAQWAFFSSELRGDAEDRITLSTDLKAAIDRDALQLALQPVVALADGSVVGAEALVRWHHDADGWISPGRFIPIAESSGLIHDLGASVLEKACRHVATRNRSEAPWRIAVNVSVLQLQASSFVEQLRAILSETGLEPQRLELEITEGAFVDHTAEIVDRLEALRAAGVTVAVDDFGTGFSSLQYLNRLPIDRLKIDRAFVSAIDSEPDNQAIVSAIVTLARQFGLKLTAEGIETAAEAECLRRLGCQHGQGFHYTRPALIDSGTDS